MDKANSKSIFNLLFSQMIELKQGRITPEQAKQQANLAKQANNVLRYELDKASLLNKFPSIKITDVEDK